MPINFELTFTQPLLLDLQNAKFADVQDYANAITKYYVNTIETGMPIGIPPTMPSPAALGAPVPVGTGPTDAFKAPYSDPKKSLFNEAVFGYFNAKDLVIAKGSLAQKKTQLESILRKAEYQTKLLENKVRTINELKERVKTVPADIKNTIEGIKELFRVFIDQIVNVKADILGFTPEQISLEKIDLKAEFAEKFPDEAKIIDSLININFSKPQEAINAIQTANTYFNKVNANVKSSVKAFEDFDASQQKDYVKARLTQIISKIFKLVNGILLPESLGALILDLKKRGERFDDKALRALTIASVASERLGVIKFIVEPEIKKLENFIKNKKINIKQELNKGKAAIQEAIQKKAKEVAEKNAKKPKKGPSTKKKWLKLQGEKVNEFKKENEDFVKTTAKNIQTLKGIITKSTALVNSGLKIKDDVITIVEDLKVDFEKTKEGFEKTQDSFSNLDLSGDSRKTTSADLRRYFNDHGAGELARVIEPIANSLSLSFLDVKKVVEKTDKKYDLLVDSLIALEEQYDDLENEAKKLANLPQINRKNTKKVKKTRTPKKQLARLKNNILVVIEKLDKFLKKIEAFTRKQIKKVESYIKKQEIKLRTFAEKIEIAIINSLPIPTEKESAQTKKEAAEEKKSIIAANKVRVEQAIEKGKAAALMGTNAVQLGTNITEGKLSAADNEPLLKKISAARFDFFTIGVDSKSSAYKYQETEKKVMDKEIATLHELDTYVSIILVMASDVKAKAAARQAEIQGREDEAIKLEVKASEIKDDPNADEDVRARLQADKEELLESAAELRSVSQFGFVERLKKDYASVVDTAGNTQEAFDTQGLRGVTPILNKLLSVFDKLFAEDADLKVNDVIKSSNELVSIAKSGKLSETLQSQELLRVFRGIEKEYLTETKKALIKILGIVPQEEEQISVGDLKAKPVPVPVRTGNITQSVEDVKKAKKEALERLGNSKVYKVVRSLYDAINEGRGSVFSILIQKIIELLQKFEAFVKEFINKAVESIKKKVQKIIEKNKKTFEEKLAANAKKKINLDLIGQTIAFNIAVQLFWTGSSWQNTVGTLFQIITLPPFPVLKINGTIDGTAAAIRELAKNLENQLPNISGLCIPAPPTGIPPFPFKGYK